jgi:ABC-2 type transport system ATP-binding protein
MRVHEYLDFFGAAFGIPRKQRVKRVEEVMELTGSTYMRDRYVDSLSHGMKQRVGVARTLVHDPPLLILDEPANGLDPNARIEMRELLLRLAEMGKTIIVTSHILPELSRICDTVAIIIGGKLQAFGTLEQIMRTISQRRIFEVQLVEAEQTERMASVLRDNLEPDAEVTPSPAEASVRFTTAADDRKLSQLLAFAVNNSTEVVQFREVPLDLEDAFLQVTGRATP